MSQSKRPGNRWSKQAKSAGRGASSRDRAKQRRQGLQKHNYSIEHMDALGQGVCKQAGAITFIAKTLPGETGVARIYKRSKGVQFASVETTEQAADHRIKPECEHFKQCPGCHYLHTSYDSELSYKKAALIKAMQPLIEGSRFASQRFDKNDLQVIAAEQRLAYRNRIQLHYRHKYIGLIDSASNQIVEIPNCKIIRPELQAAFDNLYVDKSWVNDDHSSGKDTGHCELYLNDGAVKQTWNADYADGGFSQVNESMNQVLKQLVSNELLNSKQSIHSLLDLFSGDGNLSNAICASPDIADSNVDGAMPAIKRAMVDIADNAHPDYCQIDLFDENALKQFKKQATSKSFDTFLLDPPRKGFPALANWVKHYKPKQLIYVSCNAATMARDIQSLEGKFTVDKLLLLDLFPGSYHFETVACISF